MKKNLFSKIALIAVVLAFISCKKSYNCECTTYNSQGFFVKSSSTTYKERKRETATSACVAKSSTTPLETITCKVTN